MVQQAGVRAAGTHGGFCIASPPWRAAAAACVYVDLLRLRSGPDRGVGFAGTAGARDGAGRTEGACFPILAQLRPQPRLGEQRSGGLALAECACYASLQDAPCHVTPALLAPFPAPSLNCISSMGDYVAARNGSPESRMKRLGWL